MPKSIGPFSSPGPCDVRVCEDSPPPAYTNLGNMAELKGQALSLTLAVVCSIIVHVVCDDIVRGPDWTHGDDDGPYGAGHVIYDSSESPVAPGWVFVAWESTGISGFYQMGNDGVYEVMFVTTTTSTTTTTQWSLIKECYPNATIVVNNPDPSKYVSVIASDSLTPQQCVTTWLPYGGVANAMVTVTGCDMSSVVVISFSTRVKDTGGIYGGKDVDTYKVICEEIVDNGLLMTFAVGLTPITGGVVVGGSATPTFAVSSAFRSPLYVGTDTEITSVTIGEELYWTIDIPVGYFALPVSCRVYPGTSAASSISKWLIINGCSCDVDLTEGFGSDQYYDTPTVRRYYSRIWAFKFSESDYVFFRCDLKLCPAGSDYCKMTTCPTFRKRRDVSGEDYGLTATDEADVVYLSTSRVLRVVGHPPAPVHVNSGRVVSPTKLVVIAAILLCLLID